MSSSILCNTNELVDRLSPIADFLYSDDAEQYLKEAHVSWEDFTIESDSKVCEVFSGTGMILSKDAKRASLDRQGALVLSRIMIDFEYSLSRDSEKLNRFEVYKTLKIAKNSATFLAKHKALGSKYALKFIRPGASENLSESLSVAASPDCPETIVKPYDLIEVVLRDIFDKPVKVSCVIFPFLEGETLASILKADEQPITPEFLSRFISQVGGALAYLEKKDAYHGDLHKENILVSFTPSGDVEFRILDVSYGLVGSQTADVCRNSDITLFKNHIRSICSKQNSYLKRVSARKYLGAQLSAVVKHALSESFTSFHSLVDDVESGHYFKKYKTQSSRFIEEKFKEPSGLRLLRHEEITEPSLAVKLFHPYPRLLTNLSQFGNNLVSGHRGSGKSTYLAALAFFPESEVQSFDPKEIFGIYFACRQGEFRQFHQRPENADKLSPHLKHIFILKIIRRSLEILYGALRFERIRHPDSIGNLEKFIDSSIWKERLLTFSDSTENRLKNLLDAIIRVEMSSIENLNNAVHAGEIGSLNRSRCLDEKFLIDYFLCLKETFSDLSETKFFLLFDDAGQPNIPEELQYILNDLVIAANPVFCVKISAEKFSYHFESSHGKLLEPGHDYVEQDISRTLLIGGGATGLNSQELKEYFEGIVNKRLSEFGYKGKSIAEYLGESFFSYQDFLHLLANNKRNAYFSGWDMIWRIADRTPRNLIEIVSEIFSLARVIPEQDPVIASPALQHKAIMTVSEKRFKALSLIPGKIVLSSSPHSVGKTIQKVAAAIGFTFKVYLTDSRNKKKKAELLAIERNDSTEIMPESSEVLQKLISFGVLDDSRIERARDDGVKKPIYVLNRIYSPFFGIGINRERHLRLSTSKFNMLLTDPEKFAKIGTARLEENSIENPQETLDLFKDI